MQVLIGEYEESIKKINSQIEKLQEKLPELTGKDIEVTRRKIKIYGSMVDDMILSIYQMRKYLS